MTDFKKLRSGSDVRGIADSAGGSEVQLTDEAVRGISRAFCRYLTGKLRRSRLTVAVGHDSRLSAERIRAVVVSSLRESGVDVVDCGLSGTPAMFMICLDAAKGVDAAIQITASHLPFDRNGLKFMTKEGGLEPREIEEILSLAADNAAGTAERTGAYGTCDYTLAYAAGLVRLVRERMGEERPLNGLNIVVDAGNGAGGFYAKDVLAPLGADVTDSQFLEPDGRFPNHIPNPEDAAAMHAVSRRVTERRADFGVIFDTDVDRAAAVDRHGNEINRNRLIALVSAVLLAEKPGVIVTDSVTSDGLREFIERRGGRQLRFRRGYKNVIDECKRLNGEGIYSPLAMETSGHAAFQDNHYLDDGAYLITRLLIQFAECKKEGKDLTDLIADLPEPVEAAEVRLAFIAPDFRETGSRVIQSIRKAAAAMSGLTEAQDNYEGIRINTEDGWFLARLSVHDPIMPINIESTAAGGVKRIAVTLLSLMGSEPGLDLTNLEKLISEEK